MIRYLHLAIIGLGASISFLDTSVNVAFPAITERFRLDGTEIIWLIVSFAIPSISVGLWFGRRGDEISHRFIFQFGLAWSALAFVAVTIAPNYPFFLAGRIFQGLGAAAVISCGLSLARNLFEESERGRAIGYYVIMISFAGAIGPLVGGVLIDWLGWSGVFSYRAVICVVAWGLVFTLPNIHASEQRVGLKLILLSASAIGILVGVTALLFLIDANIIFILVVIALIGLAVFGLGDFFRSLWAGRMLFATLGRAAFIVFLANNFRNILIQVAAFSVMLLAPYYLRDGRGMSFAEAGIALAFYPLGIAFLSTFAGKLFAQFDARHVGLVGIILLAMSLWFTGNWSGETAHLLLWLSLFGVGTGMGMFYTSYNYYITGVYGLTRRGLAGALIDFTRTLGILTGALVLLPIYQAIKITSPATAPIDQLLDGFTSTITLAAGIPVIMLLIGGLWYLFHRDRPENQR